MSIPYQDTFVWHQRCPCDLAFQLKTSLCPPPPLPPTLLKLRKRCLTFSCSVRYCNLEAICILRSSSPVILPNMVTLVLSTRWPMLGCPVELHLWSMQAQDVPTITVAAFREGYPWVDQCVFDNKIAETKCTVCSNFTAPHIA